MSQHFADPNSQLEIAEDFTAEIALPILLEFLRSGNDVIHKETIAFFRSYDPQGKDYLLNILKNPPKEKYHASWKNIIRRSNIGAVASAVGYLQYNQAIPLLIRIVKNSMMEEIDRVSCIKSLGDIRDLRAFSELNSFLEIQQFPIKKAAALSLGKIGNSKAIPALIKNFKYTEELREISVRALNMIPAELIALPLIKVLRYSHFGESPKIQGEAVEIDLDEGARMIAAIALGHCGAANAAVHHLMIAFHQEKDLDVCCEIIRALGISKEKETFDLLIEVANSNRIMKMRKAAIHSLGELKLQAALEHLQLLLSLEIDVELKLEICKSIAKIKGKQALNSLSPALKSPISLLKIEALKAIAEFGQGDGEAFKVVSSLVRANSYIVRAKAIEVLYKIYHKKLVPVLQETFLESNMYTQIHLADLLTRDPDKNSILILLEVILFDFRIRASICKSLKEITDHNSIKLGLKISSYLVPAGRPDYLAPQLLRFFYELNTVHELPLMHFLSLIHKYSSDDSFILDCWNRISHGQSIEERFHLFSEKGLHYFLENHNEFALDQLSPHIQDFQWSKIELIPLKYLYLLAQKSQVIYINQWIRFLNNFDALASYFQKKEQYEPNVHLFKTLWDRLDSSLSKQEILLKLQDSRVLDSLFQDHREFILTFLNEHWNELDSSSFTHSELILLFYLKNKESLTLGHDLKVILVSLIDKSKALNRANYEINLMAIHFWKRLENENKTMDALELFILDTRLKDVRCKNYFQ
ncbi:HEAT repeat domain-containing protein [bacterium]|nr:HEAT repeat domain-containing protein [bacterium]